MANLPESPVWDAGVYQIETTDAVIGGTSGIDNKAAINLANRTAYLKQHMDAAEATIITYGTALSGYGTRITTLENSRVQVLGSNYSRGVVAYNSGSPMAISASDVGKLILIQPPTLTNTVRLPAMSGIENGSVFTFVIQVTNATYYESATGFTSVDGTIAAVDPTNFTDGDTVQFVKNGTVWQCIVINKKNNAMPGDIAYFSRSTPPPGYLAADGSAVSRTTYARLFAAIGVINGVGDGVTTFNLPDTRGVFIRGYDNGRGQDPSRVLGSYQADDLKSHKHAILGNGNYNPGTKGIRLGDTYQQGYVSDGTELTGGTETRPKNIAQLGCIKY